jgi:hypothetical protein
MYTINKTSGAATLISSHGLTNNTNLGYDLNNDVMYAINSNTDTLYTVNRANGVLTSVGPLTGSQVANSMAFNHDTNVMYSTDTTLDTLLTINLQTGAITSIGSTSVGNLQGLAYINPVPEPATWTILVGAVGMLLRRRKR